MSAFMVEDKTINRVVSFVDRQLRKGVWPIIAQRFADAGFVLDEGFCERLGKAMFSLNIRGVNTRYGDREAQSFRTLTYRYQPEWASEIQVYKSLCCWRYQCMEGDIPEDPFYQLMQDITHVLADWIISHLPEYDRAVWS
jgi:hypothetical protein